MIGKNEFSFMILILGIIIDFYKIFYYCIIWLVNFCRKGKWRNLVGYLVVEVI